MPRNEWNDALDQVKAAVAEAERHTSGEIVIVVADRSSDWSGRRAMLSFATMCIVALAGTFGGGFSSVIGVDAAIILGTGFITWLVSRLPTILRWLLDDDDAAKLVLDRARAAFVECSAHATRERAGVVVYLSLLERRVQLLADTGIHRAVGSEGWQKHIDTITQGMKAHTPQRLVEVVQSIGAVLAATFPAQAAGNPNELSDEIRRR